MQQVSYRPEIYVLVLFISCEKEAHKILMIYISGHHSKYLLLLFRNWDCITTWLFLARLAFAILLLLLQFDAIYYIIGRFHVLQEFDEGKRSCRRRLAGHNKRRRKPHPDTIVNGILQDDEKGSSYLLISLLRILSNMQCKCRSILRIYFDPYNTSKWWNFVSYKNLC